MGIALEQLPERELMWKCVWRTRFSLYMLYSIGGMIVAFGLACGDIPLLFGSFGLGVILVFVVVHVRLALQRAQGMTRAQKIAHIRHGGSRL